MFREQEKPTCYPPPPTKQFFFVGHRFGTTPEIRSNDHQTITIALITTAPNSQFPSAPPTITRPLTRVRASLAGRKQYQLKCRPHIPNRLLYTPRSILHRLVAIHNAAARWTDRHSRCRNRSLMQKHRQPNQTETETLREYVTRG